MPGMSQSPINFRRSEIAFVHRLPKIDFKYPQNTTVTVVHAGSGEYATIRADVPPGTASLTLDGAHYELMQFHWHTLSEHEIEGRKTPIEMHLVHRRTDRRTDDDLLVVGVFIKRGRGNSAIESIFDNLPKHSGATHVGSGVDLMRLLPGKRASFRYAGSLTTPPFTEGIEFIVFTDPISCSKQQINAFRTLFEHGNSREVQPLNGRQILSDLDDVDDFFELDDADDD